MTMQKFILLAFAVFFLSQIAAAGEPVQVPALSSGPAASLEAEGMSVFLLPHLRRQDGSCLEPDKMRNLTDKYFVIDAEAKPDPNGYRAMLAAENEAYTAKPAVPVARQEVPTAPARQGSNSPTGSSPQTSTFDLELLLVCALVFVAVFLLVFTIGYKLWCAGEPKRISAAELAAQI